MELPRLRTSGERERALRTRDSRRTGTVDYHGTYGIAEYLAVGPQILKEWSDAYRPASQNGHQPDRSPRKQGRHDELRRWLSPAKGRPRSAFRAGSTT